MLNRRAFVKAMIGAGTSLYLINLFAFDQRPMRSPHQLFFNPNPNLFANKPFPNAKHHLVTPTYEFSGQAMHPSVIDFKIEFGLDNWGGYRYWLAFTPYPNSEYLFENPGLLVSQDGIHWDVPPGIHNPVAPKPISFVLDNYNSDPELVFDPDDNALLLYWREYSNKEFEKIWVKRLTINPMPGRPQQTAPPVTAPDIVPTPSGSLAAVGDNPLGGNLPGSKFKQTKLQDPRSPESMGPLSKPLHSDPPVSKAPVNKSPAANTPGRKPIKNKPQASDTRGLIYKLSEKILSFEKPWDFQRTGLVLSPTVWRKNAKEWYMWTSDSRFTINLYRSADGLTWGDGKACTAPWLTWNGSYRPWHLVAKPNYRTQKIEFLIAGWQRRKQVRDCILYYACAPMSDPTNITMPFGAPVLVPSQQRQWDNGFIYRSSFVIEPGEQTKYRIWYSACSMKTEWHIGYTEGVLPKG